MLQGYAFNQLSVIRHLMPNIIPKVNHYGFQGRLYRHNEEKSFFARIIAQDDRSVGPLRQTQNAFNDHAPRAIIYHFNVIVQEGRTYHPFQISCKVGDGLQINKTLLKMEARWRGDLVVLRIGKRNPLCPVDMRGKDAARVNYAVKK